MKKKFPKFMTITDFRKDIYKTTDKLKRGESMLLTKNGQVILTITKEGN